MMIYNKYLITILLLIIGTFLFSQDKTDFEIVGNLYEVKPQKSEYKQLTHDNTNELQWIASGLLIFYKSFLSSQDGNQCVFHPSCSIYAIQSIKKNGLIIGFADAMDRLSRCNRLSPEKYILFEKTNLFSDPVW
jgi:uncharacterized protein